METCDRCKETMIVHVIVCICLLTMTFRCCLKRANRKHNTFWPTVSGLFKDYFCKSNYKSNLCIINRNPYLINIPYLLKLFFLFIIYVGYKGLHWSTNNKKNCTITVDYRNYK